MTTLFSLLFLASLLGMLLGLIQPSLVLHWGKLRTRPRAVGWYGLFAVITFVGIGVTVAKPTNTTQPTEQASAAVPAMPNPAQIEATARQHAEETKASVRRIMAELLAMDQPGSDAAGFARSMAQAAGKGVNLGDVYGAFKAAKIASDDSFSRLMQYSLPKGLPATVHDKLNEAHAAFRRAAMLRSDIAETFMEWLDSHKPSLENAMQEKSGQVTLAMTKAIVSVTEAMAAAGFSDEEVKAELATMSKKGNVEQVSVNQEKSTQKKKNQ